MAWRAAFDFFALFFNIKIINRQPLIRSVFISFIAAAYGTDQFNAAMGGLLYILITAISSATC